MGIVDGDVMGFVKRGFRNKKKNWFGGEWGLRMLDEGRVGVFGNCSQEKGGNELLEEEGMR